MSYNWKDASTPQGRERLKELMESNVAVISMSGDGELSESFIEPDGTIVINHSSYEDWQDVDEMNVLFGLEFLDPSPESRPSNDLLWEAFMAGRATVGVDTKSPKEWFGSWLSTISADPLEADRERVRDVMDVCNIIHIEPCMGLWQSIARLAGKEANP
jgi:hypothetical protein